LIIEYEIEKKQFLENKYYSIENMNEKDILLSTNLQTSYFSNYQTINLETIKYSIFYTYKVKDDIIKLNNNISNVNFIKLMKFHHER
jgi:hypothetical protein